jgi:transcriptional regulator with XRE-family HTH domain
VGDHVKAKRLDLRLKQKEVAEIIAVTPETLLNWEQGHITEPTLKHWPGIIRFLGYCLYVPCPTLPEKLYRWRLMQGMGSKELAHIIGVDQRTLLKFESGYDLSVSMQEYLNNKLQNLLKAYVVTIKTKKSGQ